VSKFTQRASYALVVLAVILLSVAPVPAQESEEPLLLAAESEHSHAHFVFQEGEATESEAPLDPAFFNGLQYRNTGFNRGGRSTAVSGTPADPFTFYVGYTGGGVWKTVDAGITYQPISDGFFNVGSIGDIKVAASDPNVIFVGTGSGCPRGNISVGDGIYKSTDAGKTWTHVWNPGYVQVPEIAIHPSNPDLVYAAVLGDMFAPGEDRGIYRSTDGGESWEKTLFISDQTGFNDIEMNPKNPREMYAAAWTVERKPWSITSGSEEGGIWKSTDGGETWNQLRGGLPRGMIGKVDVTVSPANPDRVWALVEAPEDRGGVYRSDDAGQSWRQLNDDRNLRQRAWYYTHIYADPRDPDTVYALNTGFYKSTDGGSTFPTSFRVRHGDNHDLWINPDDPDIMVNANDGGANVTLTGGTSWSEQMNQSTAEFYRVTVDNRFPYRVYGAQQDNSTAAMEAAGGGRGRGDAGFYSVGGGESGHIAVDPRNPNIVYAGSYGGSITRMDTDTGMTRSIRAYTDVQTGQQAADMKYRFQWNAPIRISPHNPDVVYHTSQFVHRTTDGGHSWEVISPDLTTNDPTKQGYSGGEGITRDSTGVEVYTTIFALEESPYTPGLLWAGSDDGLIHVSQDNGATWANITPPMMPEDGTINMIDLSVHSAGRVNVAVYRYRMGDFRPYIFQTSDFGASWSLLTDGTNGIPDNHFVRVVREDPNREGVLYAGTEFGMYASFDNGANWQPFQLNLPVTPITDMVITHDDLVVATQGRAFWVIDNISALGQITDEVRSSDAWLFTPRTSYRGGGSNPEIRYYLGEAPTEEMKLEILDSRGEVVQELTATPGERPDQPSLPPGIPPEFAAQFRAQMGGGTLSASTGMNTFRWNGRYDAIYEVPDGIVQWAGGNAAGPKAVPGTYQVRLTVGDWSQTRSLDYQKDPRLETTQADFVEQLGLAREVGAYGKHLYDALLQLRSVQEQALEIGKRLDDAGYGDEALTAAREMNGRLDGVESKLTQVQGEAGQDALNFPGQLDNQINAVYSTVSGPDTPVLAGAKERWDDLQPQLQPLLDQIQEIYSADLVSFNELVRNMGAGPVIMKTQQ
jgi:photosystem II stability/assembly factor-like uncharacterized protein